MESVIKDNIQGQTMLYHRNNMDLQQEDLNYCY